MLLKFKIQLFLFVCILFVALFIGRTTINLEPFSIKIERPLTAIFLILTYLASIVEDIK